jgi:hypothetical protein
MVCGRSACGPVGKAVVGFQGLFLASATVLGGFELGGNVASSLTFRQIVARDIRGDIRNGKLFADTLTRYFEVEAALAQHPKDRKLRAELKELKKYKDFLEKTGERNLRREAVKQARRALQTDSPKPKRRASGTRTARNDRSGS